MTSSGYLSFPHVQGDLIVFAAEDDVWLAPAAGGRGWRLSADQALASRPRFSRDGAQIAWTGSHPDSAEVYLADTEGGVSRRLTFWGDERTQVCGWTPSGEVLVISAVGQPFNHLSWAHAISPDQVAGAPVDARLPYGPVADVAVEPSGVALLTGSMRRDPAHWKRYRGGTSGRLWVRAGAGGPAGEGAAAGDAAPAGDGVAAGAAGNAPEGFRRLLAEVHGQFTCPMLVGGRLVFLSDHEGTGNLYSCALDGSGLRRHTDHDGSYARQASTDGQRIVYSCAGAIWMLDGLDAGEPRPLEVQLGSVPPGRAPRLISADDHVGSLSCDAAGRASAVEVRGTVHWLTHRDGPALALSEVSGARARLPQVLGTDGEVVWVTDADGQDALEIGTSGGAGVPPAPRRLAGGLLDQVGSMAAAPDGSKVAVASQDGGLRVVDVASGDVTEVAASDNGPLTGLAWSTDSKWLAWSEPALYPLRRLRIASIPGGQVTDITDGRFTDTDPVFTIDGKHLAFLSKRSFDPVYDAHFFDLAFPYGARPYLMPLAASTLSPFGPQPGGRDPGEGAGDDSDGGKAGRGGAAAAGASAAGGDGAAGGGEAAGSDGGAGGSGGTPAVTVDTEGMADRIVALPVPESRYSSLRAVKGGLAWLREPVTGSLGEGGARPGDSGPRSSLQRFDLRRHAVTVLADEADWFEASGDGSKLVVSDHGSLTVLPGDRKSDPDSPDDQISVDGSRARFLADPAALWQHAYGEVGRIIRHDFWVADLADVDWDGALAQYRPLLDLVATPREFADVVAELVGELGSSHAYVNPAHGGDRPGFGSGLLGADLERGSDGEWLVGRIVPGESSDPRARSPLTAPGVQIRPGDRLLAVDGRAVGADGPGPLLAGSAGKPVELTVAGGNGESPRRVVVVPLASERRLRYQDWVTGRRALVRELSEGRVGYLHVPDMVGEGWADFHRDLRAEMTRDALIVDARANRGGHTSQLVVEKIARRVIAWDMPRGSQPQSYPIDAPRGPVVAVADEFAGSDGDIVTRAIRTLALGPIVGARTWGGVIGIDGWRELVDGTQITVPQYAFWMEGVGWGVENYGVEPDIEMLITPDDWAAGRDTQLQTAVALAVDALAIRPPAAPPSREDRPSRRRPPLPPRPGQPG